ncbi:hypothetical protein [Actinospica robiniae]|uniref:hypothetical protein n=1 Tax=Actinospica robiniae TaxID=304901 RepID=UPI0004292061|nr:hypothetical protein [Actinospica robiniae]
MESAAAPARAERVRADAGRHGNIAWACVLAAAFAGGAVLLRFAYAQALDNALTGFGSASRYGLFWAGVAVFLLPAAVRLLTMSAGGSARRIVVTAVAVFTYIPRVLRSPTEPLFFDELAHWTQAQHLHDSGKLFQPNVVTPISSYPGLHLLTVALRYFSGLDTYQAGLVIGGLGHVLELLAVFFLARRITGSDHIAGIAGLCYALNPGYLLFTAEYAYETLALIFVAWAFALLQLTGPGAGPARVRTAWAVLIGVLVAATAVTHPLSALILTFLTLVFAVAGLPWRAPLRVSAPPVLLTAFGIAANLAWIAAFGFTVLSYLTPYPSQGLRQLTTLITHGGHSAGSGRGAFQQTDLPRYAVDAAYAAPVLVTLGAAAGIWIGRRWLRRSPMFRTVALICVFYPLSFPLVLTTQGAPGAHRSWPFAFLALAVPVAVAVGAWCAYAARNRYGRASVAPVRMPRGGVGRRRAGRLAAFGAVPVCAVAALAVVVGGSAGENNDAGMFPGPWAFADGRIQSPELSQLTAWALQTQGSGHNFIADYFTGGVFGAFADDFYLVGFPSWDLYFYDGSPKAQTLERLGPDNVTFMLVDTRLAKVPNTDYYFSSSEPGAYQHTSPIPLSALEKFTAFPWAAKIYQSENYALYRVQPTELHAGVYGEAP